MEGNLANFGFPKRNTALVALATQIEWKKLKAQASLLSTFVDDKVKYRTASKQKPQFTPAAFLTYQPILHEEWYLRGFYKRIFRMPTFNDLYYTDVGNIALLPEYTTQYDGGMEYNKVWETGFVRTVGAKIDGYFNKVKNKIVAIPKGNGQYRWQMMNLGTVHIRGLDVNGSATFYFGRDVFFNASLAYTYQKAQDFTDPTEITYKGQIAYIPWHSGSVTANLQWRGLNINYAFVYVGERYHNSANIPANYEQPWYTHDMSVSYELTLKGKVRLHFGGELNNMFNQQYDVILNYPMPGINGKGIIKVIL